MNSFTAQVSKAERIQMAKEMYIGCDLVHEKHMNLIKEVFEQCKEIQAKRELILKEMAQLA